MDTSPDHIITFTVSSIQGTQATINVAFPEGRHLTGHVLDLALSTSPALNFLHLAHPTDQIPLTALPVTFRAPLHALYAARLVLKSPPSFVRLYHQGRNVQTVLPHTHSLRGKLLGDLPAALRTLDPRRETRDREEVLAAVRGAARVSLLNVGDEVFERWRGWAAGGYAYHHGRDVFIPGMLGGEDDVADLRTSTIQGVGVFEPGLLRSVAVVVSFRHHSVVDVESASFHWVLEELRKVLEGADGIAAVHIELRWDVAARFEGVDAAMVVKALSAIGDNLRYVVAFFAALDHLEEVELSGLYSDKWVPLLEKFLGTAVKGGERFCDACDLESIDWLEVEATREDAGGLDPESTAEDFFGVHDEEKSDELVAEEMGFELL